MAGPWLPLMYAAWSAAAAAWRTTGRLDRAVARFARPGHLFAIVLAMAPLIFSIGSGAAKEREYRLGPQDKVRILINQWRPARAEFFEWPALNREFTVSASGTLSLPFAGEMDAAGLSARELADSIATRLQEAMSLVEPPSASVEVVQFRPFYIMGEVEKPGEFSFRPGLTVIQAVSLAGGLRRNSDLTALERERIATEGELQVLSAQLNGLAARRARLYAEQVEAKAIEFPPELEARRAVRSASLILDQEQRIFQSRRDALESQVQALEKLRDFLEQEEKSLKAQLQLEETQARLIRKELEAVTTLVSKGLAPASRQSALERMIAQIEGDRLRAETAVLKARQDTSRTEISIVELRSKRASEVAAELRETEAKLEEARRKHQTTEIMLQHSREKAAQLSTRARGVLDVQAVFTITRSSGSEKQVSATELVEPGDTIDVKLQLQDIDGEVVNGAATVNRTAGESSTVLVR